MSSNDHGANIDSLDGLSEREYENAKKKGHDYSHNPSREMSLGHSDRSHRKRADSQNNSNVKSNWKSSRSISPKKSQKKRNIKGNYLREDQNTLSNQSN